MTIQEGSSPKSFLILAVLALAFIGAIGYTAFSSTKSEAPRVEVERTTSESSDPLNTAKSAVEESKNFASQLIESVKTTVNDLTRENQTELKNTPIPTVFVPKISGDETGADLFRLYGCPVCHSLDGSKKIGPSLKGIGGAERTCRGRKISVDEKYLQLIMIDPNSCSDDPKRKSIMPSYSGVISPDRRFAIAKYLKTLR